MDKFEIHTGYIQHPYWIYSITIMDLALSIMDIDPSIMDIALYIRDLKPFPTTFKKICEKLIKIIKYIKIKQKKRPPF
jgi:hypothetical protein